jgi:probable HAF family extracellular repeat protein
MRALCMTTGNSDAWTDPFGINDAGQIVGEYETANGSIYGFQYSKGKFSNIVYPGSSGTRPNAINDDGQIVGDFYSSSGGDGFLDSPNSTTKFAAINSCYTSGINGDSLVLVQEYISINCATGALYDPITNSTLPLEAVMYGVNSSLVMVGGSEVFDYKTGTQISLSFPGAASGSTLAYGINDCNSIVGEYNFSNSYGFLATPTGADGDPSCFE